MFQRSPYHLVAFAAAMLVMAGTASAQALPSGWSTTDIGITGAPGAATATGSTFTLRGAGLDVWGTSDQFHFTYTALTGDGAVVARVTTVDPVAAWTKAGVMMRETLSAGSKHAFMLVSPGKGLAFQRRAATGGSSTHTSGGAGVAPYWVRLERQGNVFTASKSVDGNAWTVVDTQTTTMAPTIYVGVAIGSHVTGVLAAARFEAVSVTGALPSGWSSGDIGTVGAAGSATSVNGSFVLQGAGLDVWGSADQFHFTYRTLTGDGAIVARVSSIQNVHAWTKAGVMMRETLASHSKHAFMLVSPGKGLAYQRRSSTGGTSVHTSGGDGTSPYYVKIERMGNVFTASKSTDGSSWSVVGTHTITMSPTIYVGVALGSHVTGVLATASFDGVAVTQTEPPPLVPPSATFISGTPNTPPSAGATLRVLQWNVSHGGRRTDGVYDPENTVKWMLTMNPDVASLNEFDNATQANKILSLLRTKTGLDWQGYFDGRGNLLVSKLPVIDKDICIVNASVGRKAASMTVLANGRPVSIYSAHLSLTQSERITEVPALQACASNKVQSRVLAGDYNMQAGSPEYNQAMVGHVDAWKAAKTLGSAVNYAGNCDGCTKNSRIDYVFTSTGATSLALKSAQIYDTRNAAGVAASDHKPMVVVYDVK